MYSPSMTNPVGSRKRISLQLRNQEGTVYTVAARYIFPFFDATYHLSRTEQQHFTDWIRDLGIGVLA